MMDPMNSFLTVSAVYSRPLKSGRTGCQAVEYCVTVRSEGAATTHAFPTIEEAECFRQEVS